MISTKKLARSADLPKHLPTITHPIYGGSYSTSYGDCDVMDDHFYHWIYLIVARARFDNILYYDEDLEEEKVISKHHYRSLVEKGQMIQWSARTVLTREHVEEYVEVAGKVIGYMDADRGKEWSQRLVDKMEREVLVAYWLKAMEIVKRWPARVAALGLGSLTLGGG
ncbi:hypothetical protein G7Y79_00021g050850 [Physcia stellaris]|nr:hypothetical protein G7Y79_00021g050850 [Physcia stellaris]